MEIARVSNIPCAIYITLDVNEAPHLVPIYSKPSVLQITLFRSGSPSVHGAIWRQKLVPAIVIAIFRSCFRMHIYIYVYICVHVWRVYVASIGGMRGSMRYLQDGGYTTGPTQNKQLTHDTVSFPLSPSFSPSPCLFPPSGYPACSHLPNLTLSRLLRLSLSW